MERGIAALDLVKFLARLPITDWTGALLGEDGGAAGRPIVIENHTNFSAGGQSALQGQRLGRRGA